MLGNQIVECCLSHVRGVSNSGNWGWCHPTSLFFIGVLRFLSPQKESWRFNSTLRFPPSAHSCRAVLVWSHGELCTNKLWDNVSVGFRVLTSFTKRYTSTRNYSMWLWRAHLRQWNQWAFSGLKGWACWRVCTPLSSSCQADFWDMLPREFARRKPAWIL